jgi:hypothetical protein
VKKLNPTSPKTGIDVVSHKNVRNAIRRAERILPGTPAPEGDVDPRWQAIIAVGNFVESEPEVVWGFVQRWGRHANPDLRASIATCLLEHLLEHHFDLIFPYVEHEVSTSKSFGDTLSRCFKFGQAKKPLNAKKIDRLIQMTQPTKKSRG